MSEERGFEVRDRRRVRAEPVEAGTDQEAAADPTAAETVGNGASAEAAPDAGVPIMGRFSVDGVLQMTIGLLHEKAWAALGLTPDPVTGEIGQDLPEARRAIDVIADLVKHMEPGLEPADRRELQNMLSNLRLNFVNQSRQE